MIEKQRKLDKVVYLRANNEVEYNKIKKEFPDAELVAWPGNTLTSHYWFKREIYIEREVEIK
jgi:hypothetical protein